MCPVWHIPPGTRLRLLSWGWAAVDEFKVAFATVKSLDETTRQRREKRERALLTDLVFQRNMQFKKIGI